jgi:hypothetical protein
MSLCDKFKEFSPWLPVLRMMERSSASFMEFGPLKRSFSLG